MSARKKWRGLVGWSAAGSAAALLCWMWGWHPGFRCPPPDPTKLRLMVVEQMLVEFHLDRGTLPGRLDALLEPGDGANRHGPFARDEQSLRDPWGHPIVFEAIDDLEPRFRLCIVTPRGERVTLMHTRSETVGP